MSDKYFTTNIINNGTPGGLQPLDFTNPGNMKLNNGARTASSINDPVINYKNEKAPGDNYTGNQLGEFSVESERNVPEGASKLNFTLGKATTSEDFKYMRLVTDEDTGDSSINSQEDDAAAVNSRKDAIAAIYNTGTINAIKYRDSNGK